jgi:hypothetical protein
MSDAEQLKEHQYKPGHVHTVVGRPPGSVNRITADLRKYIFGVIEEEMPNLQTYIKRTAVRNPEGAAKLVLGLIDYCLPKLNRVEHTGKDGEDLAVTAAKLAEAVTTAPSAADAAIAYRQLMFGSAAYAAPQDELRH